MADGGWWMAHGLAWPTFVVAASFNDAPSAMAATTIPDPLSHALALALLVSGPGKCKNHANYRNMRKHTPTPGDFAA